MKKLSSRKEEREVGSTGLGFNLRKRLKLPRKVLRDCNSVNHVKVPRKLRSAMKRRNSESASPPLPNKKKRNNAIDGVRFGGDVGKKKLRRNDAMETEITKDEEEAVETLFSLANMFPNNNKNGFKRESIEAKSTLIAPENEEAIVETLEEVDALEEVKCSIVPISSVSESEPRMITNSKPLVYEEPTACERNPDIAAAIAAAVGNLHAQEFTTENSKNIRLWPGLSSAVSFGADTKGSPINSPTAYNPTWTSLKASRTEPSSLKMDTLADKDCRDPFARNKSWKRCLAHAHIGHLIKDLQTADKTKNISILPLNQLAKNEGPKQEDAHIDKSVSEIAVVEKNQNETRNAILLHKRLIQDQQQPFPTSTLYTANKQSLDFLSLSTGGGGVEATKTATKTGNLIGPWGPFHIPYLQSIAQNYANVPFSLPQSRYSTSTFSDHFPATAAKQVQTHLQSYSSNTIIGPTQIQHQQRIWASHFASQYKPMGFSFPHNNLNMQNQKQDQTLELLRPMFIPMNPQQGHNLVPMHLLYNEHI